MKKLKIFIFVAILMIFFLMVNAIYIGKSKTQKNNIQEVQNIQNPKTEPQNLQPQEVQNLNMTQQQPQAQPFYTQPQMERKMKLTTDFEHMGNIPSVYTCDGQDSAPILNISDVPQNAKELVLIVDDPDAPARTWVHWVLYNISPDTKIIDNKNLPPDVKQGMTDFGRIGWGGPCPPNGQHRYFFKLYAIDTKLNLEQGATKAQVEEQMQNHIIEKFELIGLYDRIRK